MVKPLTICVLFYGDYLDLATRCLSSIEEALMSGHEFVREFRFGFNSTTSAVSGYVNDWASRISSRHGVPSLLINAQSNRLKYPMMRRMLYWEPIQSEFVMWFDDDSYLEKERSRSWWRAMFEAIAQNDMIGQFWLMAVQGDQLKWVTTQPWYDKGVGPPPKRARGRHAFEFCQGGWWVIRTDVLRDNNWPVPEIRHNGGDSMLGEMLRHRGLRMGRFYGGVRINADKGGKHSGAKRRGVSENRIGWDYNPDVPYNLSFQSFVADKFWIGRGSSASVSPPDSAIHLFKNP